MNSPNQPDDTLISITDILAVLRYRWMPGLAVAMLLAGTLAIVLMKRPPVYEASATLRIETSGERVLSNMDEVVDSEIRGGELELVVNTLIGEIGSGTFAAKVASNLTALRSRHPRRGDRRRLEARFPALRPHRPPRQSRRGPVDPDEVR